MNVVFVDSFSDLIDIGTRLDYVSVVVTEGISLPHSVGQRVPSTIESSLSFYGLLNRIDNSPRECGVSLNSVSRAACISLCPLFSLALWCDSMLGQ
jgi:hypothetical protein